MFVYGLLNFKDVLNMGERHLLQWEKGNDVGEDLHANFTFQTEFA